MFKPTQTLLFVKVFGFLSLCLISISLYSQSRAQIDSTLIQYYYYRDGQAHVGITAPQHGKNQFLKQDTTVTRKEKAYGSSIAVSLSKFFSGQDTMANGQETSFSINVTSGNSTCGYYNGSLVIVASGGTSPYTFKVNDIIQNNGYFIGLIAGNYTITVTDATGMTASANAVVNNTLTPAHIELTNIKYPTSCAIEDGYVTVTATGGLPPYEYSMDGITYSTGNVYNNLSNGRYVFFVRDANGCVSRYDTNLTFFTRCNFSLGSDITVGACTNEGQIFLNAFQGQPPYTYSLDGVNYNDSGIFKGLAPGIYHCYSKDATGYVAISNFLIEQICPVKIDLINVDASCGKNDGVLTTIVDEGTPPYLYTLDGVNYQATNVFTGLAPGNYTVVVKDANGYLDGKSATLYDKCPAVDAYTSNETCDDKNGSITANGTNGTLPYQFSIDGVHFQTSNAFSGLSGGNYTVTIKDAKGFEAVTTVTVIKICLKVSAVAIDESCSSHNGSIAVTGSGGTLPYFYSIDGINFQVSNVFNGLPAGNYTVTIKDITGAVSNTSVTINNTGAQPLNLGNDTTFCPNTTLVLNPNVQGNIVDYTWQDGSTNSSYTVSQSGKYWTSIGVNGCIVSDTINVSYLSLATSIFPAADTTLCVGSILLLDAGFAGADYLWDNKSTNHTRSITSSGTYWVSIKTSGCFIADTITCTFINGPQLTLPKDTTGCSKGTITLKGGIDPTILYQWNDLSTADTLLVSASGVYSVAASANGCTTRDTVQVNFNPTPDVFLGNDTTLCSGATYLLQAPSGTHYQYEWQDDSKAQNYLVAAKGTYAVKVTNGYICSSADTIKINYISSPVISLGNDTTLCNGMLWTKNLDGIPGTFLWSTGSTKSDFTANTPGSYWLTVTNDGCSASDTVMIDYKPNPMINLGNDTILCIAQQLILDEPQNGYSYLWQDGSTQSSYTIKSAGVYSVRATANGCDTIGKINVAYTSKPSVNFGKDTTLCQNDFIALNALYPLSTYLWQDGSINPSYTINHAGIYSVVVTNQCGQTSDTVIADYKQCACEFYMPSAFTPNEDGRNDVFKPVFRCSLSNYSMYIYNRFGKIVFSSKNNTTGWNGTSNSQPQENGCYIWVVSYKDNLTNMTVYKSGTVILIK